MWERIVARKTQKKTLWPTWIISKYLSHASLKQVARISPLSSIRSMLNSFPSPRAFDQVRTFDFDVTRALITHLFWYGVKLAMAEVIWFVIDDWEKLLDEFKLLLALPFDAKLLPLAGLAAGAGSAGAGVAFGTSANGCGSPIFVFTSEPGWSIVRSKMTTTFLQR